MPSPQGQGNLLYEFGPFRLDTEERLLLRDDRTVHLTDKTFDLLVELVHNSGHLMEIDELRHKVWTDVIIAPDTLAKYISMLRKALGDTKKERRYIETLPKRGYRFMHEVKKVRRRRVLVVLPFQPSGRRPSGSRLGLGVAAAVISKLDSIGVKDLIVRPTNAIHQYNTPNQDPLAAAREQSADYVVSGLLQSSGKLVRVNVEFLSAHNNKKIWTREFTEEIKGNLSVQEALGNSIANDVALSLGHDAIKDKKQVAGDYTTSTEAYQLYVDGRFHWNRFTRAGFKEAIKCFNRAIKKDPRYAKAFAGIADCWLWLGIYSLLPPDRAFLKAHKWAARSLEISPNLSGAQATMAFIDMFVRRERVVATRRFEHVITLNPDNIKAHLGYSLLLTGLKQFDTALKEIDKALEIYSASLINKVVRAMILYEARRYDESLLQFQKAIKFDENFDAIYHGQALAYAQLGDYRRAIPAAQTAIKKSSNNLLNHMVLAYVLAKKGARTEARAIIKRLEALDMGKWYVSPFHIATVYTALGQWKRARHWLEVARDRHDPWFIWLNTEPRLDPLRSDPSLSTEPWA